MAKIVRLGCDPHLLAYLHTFELIFRPENREAWSNGQILVTCYYADPVWDWPVAGRLYLPERWARDSHRRRQGRVPEEVGFASKPEVALALSDWANEAGIPHRAVVADAAYGDNAGFLGGLEQRGECYVVGVSKDFTVRLPHEVQAERQAPRPRRGRPRTRPTAPLHTAATLLDAQLASAWRTVEWREGTNGTLRKQFCALRAHRATREKTGIQGWLIFERPVPGEDEDLQIGFNDFPEETPLERVVERAHRRYLVERGDQDEKQELGLDDFQGRTWWGFHRHVALGMLAHCFLVMQRWVLAELTPPRPTPTPEPRRPALSDPELVSTSLKSLVAPLVQDAPSEWNGQGFSPPLFPPRVSLAWPHRLIRVAMAAIFPLQVCADLLAWLRILLGTNLRPRGANGRAPKGGRFVEERANRGVAEELDNRLDDAFRPAVDHEPILNKSGPGSWKALSHVRCRPCPRERYPRLSEPFLLDPVSGGDGVLLAQTRRIGGTDGSAGPRVAPLFTVGQWAVPRCPTVPLTAPVT